MVIARTQGEKVLRAPEIEPARNSQTIALLEGYLNIDPTNRGGPDFHLVNGTMLGAEGETTVFVDAPKSGGQVSVYVVRKGDTLSDIAEMFDVSVNTIVWANDIKGGKISEGQELVILPTSGVRHVVKSGDTLRSIANKYKAELDDVLAYNDISLDTKLKVGDVVIVPGGEVTSSTAGTTKSSGATNAGTKIDSSGYFTRPIAGGRKSQGNHNYNAVDLAAPVGTKIVAAASGKVVVSRLGGYNGGYGTYIVISHPNGTQTLYAHMKDNYVAVGQTVEKGQSIGTIGMTGRTTGPHIHFEVRGAKNPF